MRIKRIGTDVRLTSSHPRIHFDRIQLVRSDTLTGDTIPNKFATIIFIQFLSELSILILTLVIFQSNLVCGGHWKSSQFINKIFIHNNNNVYLCRKPGCALDK